MSNDTMFRYSIITVALRKKLFQNLIKLLLAHWLFEVLQINLQIEVLKLSKVSKFFKTENVSKGNIFNYKNKQQ